MSKKRQSIIVLYEPRINFLEPKGEKNSIRKNFCSIELLQVLIMK